MTSNVPTYILGADESERERLLLQCQIHRRDAQLLLDRLQVGPGERVLDLGCGPLGVLDLLSSRVGANGSVIGLDNEPRMIAYARQTITERKLANVELVLGDATDTGFAPDSFDLVHARLVLINHPAPEDIVGEMVRVTGPGGWVVAQEVDMVSWACEPANPAWDALRGALVGAWRTAGQDPFIGRRLSELLHQAGLSDVGYDTQAHRWRSGDLYQTLLLRFVDIYRDRILQEGALTEDDLDHLSADLARHLARPDTSVAHALFCQAWGRKPGAAIPARRRRPPVP